ncbi:MAG: peptidylprolyl isomerase [Anaerolineae bacterium]
MRFMPAALTMASVLATILMACSGGTATPNALIPTTPPTADLVQPTQPAAPTTPGVASTPTPSEPGSEAGDTTASTEPPPGIVAEVNGVGIPMAEFQRQLTDARTYLLSEGLIDPDTEDGQARLQALRDQVLDQLIDQTLITQAAEQMDLSVSDEELEESISNIKATLASDDAFAESLAANNLTEEQFRDLQRQQLLSRKVMDTITADVPDEAEQVHARHILVETEEDAESILEQLQNGADFAELAKENSTDETTRENGGDLGFFPRGVVLAEFEEAAFALDVGERSSVVQTPYGYHIIEVLERETRPVPDEIKEGLRQQVIINWLEAQRAQADIKRYLDR